jgi:hypothetical protein
MSKDRLCRHTGPVWTAREVADGEAVAFVLTGTASSKLFTRRPAERPRLTSPSIFSTLTARTFVNG